MNPPNPDTIQGIIVSGLITLLLFLAKYITDLFNARRVEKIKKEEDDRKAIKDAEEKAKQDEIDRQKMELAEREQAIKEVRAKFELQQSIEESNTKIAMALRDEMRKDRQITNSENDELRFRMRESEQKNAKTEARVDELGKINDGLRRENMDLSVQNGAQKKQLDIQADQIKEQEVRLANQAERITVLEKIAQELGDIVKKLDADRTILISAMEAKGIPIPETVQIKTTVLSTVSSRSSDATQAPTETSPPKS